MARKRRTARVPLFGREPGRLQGRSNAGRRNPATDSCAPVPPAAARRGQPPAPAQVGVGCLRCGGLWINSSKTGRIGTDCAAGGPAGHRRVPRAGAGFEIEGFSLQGLRPFTLLARLSHEPRHFFRSRARLRAPRRMPTGITPSKQRQQQETSSPVISQQQNSAAAARTQSSGLHMIRERIRVLGRLPL